MGENPDISRGYSDEDRKRDLDTLNAELAKASLAIHDAKWVADRLQQAEALVTDDQRASVLTADDADHPTGCSCDACEPKMGSEWLEGARDKYYRDQRASEAREMMPMKPREKCRCGAEQSWIGHEPEAAQFNHAFVAADVSREEQWIRKQAELEDKCESVSAGASVSGVEKK